MTVKAAAVPLLLYATAGAVSAQGACSDSGALADCPALMAHSVTQTFLRDRIARSGATVPDSRFDARLNGRAWDPNANGAMPFSIQPGGDGAGFSTSLSQWGSWEAKSDAETINQAKPLLKDGKKAPAPVKVGGRQVDVWTQTRVSGLKNEPLKNGEQAYTSEVGADYRLRPGLLVGGVVQLDSAEKGNIIPGGSASGQGFMAGPYVAMKLSPNVTMDAKAAWGQADDSVKVGTSSSDFTTTRRQVKARVKGNWNWSNWRFTPNAAIESRGESANSPTDSSAAEASTERVSVGPRLSRQVDLGDGKKLVPFVHMNSSVDLDTAGAMLRGNDGEAQKTVGAGVHLSQTDEFNFQATADVDDPGNGADSNVRGGVKLTIPLN